MLVVILMVNFLVCVSGHGNQVIPSTWFNPGGLLGPDPAHHCVGVFSACQWFSNFTFIQGQPTLDPAFWTYSKVLPYPFASDSPFHHPMGTSHHSYLDLRALAPDHSLKDIQPLTNDIPPLTNDIPPLSSETPNVINGIPYSSDGISSIFNEILSPRDPFERNPWRSPGTAFLHSSCGVGGGNPLGCPPTAEPWEGNSCPGGGYGYGPRAEDFPFRDVITTDWVVGSEAEVGWGITANHGGGYSYRLCRLPEDGRSGLTESCFQAGHLDFVGDSQWVQYRSDGRNRTEFKADRTRKGTFPPGSQWTKNPIPACAGAMGGFFDKDPFCRRGTQFPPHGPGLYGFGVHFDPEKKVILPLEPFHFTIIDKVKIPSGLEPGQYVLSFRWDCEQTPQVWSACSSINIIKSHQVQKDNEKFPKVYFA